MIVWNLAENVSLQTNIATIYIYTFYIIIWMHFVKSTEQDTWTRKMQVPITKTYYYKVIKLQQRKRRKLCIKKPWKKDKRVSRQNWGKSNTIQLKYSFCAYIFISHVVVFPLFSLGKLTLNTCSLFKFICGSCPVRPQSSAADRWTVPAGQLGLKNLVYQQ